MMKSSLKKSILATVELPILMPLEDLALKLEEAIGDISFEREDTGRFEEVPAFVAEETNMAFVLWGVPEREHSDVYILEMSAETPLPIEEFRNSTLGFASPFLHNKEPNSRGYLDYSDELANALCSRGIRAYKLT